MGRKSNRGPISHIILRDAQGEHVYKLTNGRFKRPPRALRDGGNAIASVFVQSAPVGDVRPQLLDAVPANAVPVRLSRKPKPPSVCRVARLLEMNPPFTPAEELVDAPDFDLLLRDPISFEDPPGVAIPDLLSRPVQKNCSAGRYIYVPA
jgi:hypothetical protein